ncbi:MAG: Nif3-like dinuclear metal center hexameric protein [Bacteroidetes bacterium]|nr:Nif3-like dinuclear metal center hexameric protein [Bacteroidota bacterium]
MIISQLIEVLEEWAPRWTAWDRDNVGLLVGDPHRRVSRILVALEVTPKVVDEAITRKVELIITHHPLLFRPLMHVTSTDPIGAMVLTLAENRIALYAAHTNLDVAKNGVSFLLAEKLGLHNVRFLKPLEQSLAKIVVFVPEVYVESLRTAMARAGAGVIGEYSYCSFATRGEGSFFGSSASDPSVGKKGKLEVVPEVRLEMVAPRARLSHIVTVMKDVHPYEEVAYDVVNIETPSSNYGMGAIGEFPKPMPMKKFLKHVKKVLRTQYLRCSTINGVSVHRVAVCGGAGSELLQDAARAKADVFLTGDVGYHKYHNVPNSLVLIDAGHWETEQFIVHGIVHHLQKVLSQTGSAVKVLVSTAQRNAVTYE